MPEETKFSRDHTYHILSTTKLLIVTTLKYFYIHLFSIFNIYHWQNLNFRYLLIVVLLVLLLNFYIFSSTVILKYFISLVFSHSPHHIFAYITFYCVDSGLLVNPQLSFVASSQSYIFSYIVIKALFYKPTLNIQGHLSNYFIFYNRSNKKVLSMFIVQRAAAIQRRWTTFYGEMLRSVVTVNNPQKQFDKHQSCYSRNVTSNCWQGTAKFG